jgi:hypothetical protein
MHLWLKFYVERPVFDSEQLEHLHQLLLEMLPEWSRHLKVFKTEYKRKGRDVEPEGSLFRAVHAESPARHGIGTAVLKGAYDGVQCLLNTCASTIPAQLNCVTFEIDTSIVESESPEKWAMRFFRAAIKALPIRYARAHLTDEFDAKNLQCDSEGTRAIGVRLDKVLPGIYWLNFLGEPYVRLIGMERLLSIPAYEVQSISNGVLFILDVDPTAWQTAAYKDRENTAIAHIGREYVFSRNDMNRPSIGAEFRK